MALLTPLALGEARGIGAEYGLDLVAVDALTAGSVNSNFAVRTARGERYFLRVYEEQGRAGAVRELAMIAALAGLGVPTPAPLVRLQGGHASQHAGKPVGVHPWVLGESLCGAQVTAPRIRELGRALARVHDCSGAVPEIPEGRFRIPDLLVRLDYIDQSDARFAADTRLIRERIAHHSEASPPAAAARGLIHGDLFRDNVLWRGDSLVGLLDFESASVGIFVYDLMVLVHAWCYRESYDLSLVAALFEGYTEVRQLSAEEWSALLPQGCLSALRFATTRITDFSMRAPVGQAPARDYRRFLARLAALEAGVLDPIIERGRS